MLAAIGFGVLMTVIVGGGLAGEFKNQWALTALAVAAGTLSGLIAWAGNA